MHWRADPNTMAISAHCVPTYAGSARLLALYTLITTRIAPNARVPAKNALQSVTSMSKKRICDDAADNTTKTPGKKDDGANALPGAG